MLIRTISASIAALVAFGILASTAEADHRKKYRRLKAYDTYYAGPQFVYGIPGRRLLFGDYALTEEEFDAIYGIDEDDRRFDEGYYEPKPVTPAKPKNKKKPASKTKTTAKKPAASDVTTASVSKPADATTSSQKTAATSGSLSCDKATAIVSGFGFQSVKPETCKGKTYAFAATRDGKNFAVKLDAASGELTEVKKLQ